jgi:hypothetical protein
MVFTQKGCPGGTDRNFDEKSVDSLDRFSVRARYCCSPFGCGELAESGSTIRKGVTHLLYDKGGFETKGTGLSETREENEVVDAVERLQATRNRPHRTRRLRRASAALGTRLVVSVGSIVNRTRSRLSLFSPHFIKRWWF